MKQVIKQIKDATGLDYSHELNDILINRERLVIVLESTKHITKDDRALLADAIVILEEIYKYNDIVGD